MEAKMEGKVTALSGALVRRGPDDWVWADNDEQELRAYDMHLGDLSFDCRICVSGNGTRSAEGLAKWPGYRSRFGWWVPLETWDGEVGRVVGVWWDRSDERDVLERALRVRGER